MKGWVGLVGWPVADGLPTLVVTHQLQVERRTGKVRRPETDVLPLSHATNEMLHVYILTRAQKPTWPSLIYRTEPTTRKWKKQEDYKVKNGYAQKYR